jgi:hypothetical protein
MPEGMNLKVAHKLSEQEKTDRHKRRWEEVAEIVEVLFLAIASSPPHGAATRPPRGRAISRCCTGSDRRPIRRRRRDLGRPQLAADSAMFNGWLQARAANNPQLQQEFVRRFTPDYRSAVAA